MKHLSRENVRSDFKSYDYRESIPGMLGAFSGKLVPDIDGFTDESEVQCDVQVVKNTLVHDSK